MLFQLQRGLCRQESGVLGRISHAIETLTLLDILSLAGAVWACIEPRFAPRLAAAGTLHDRNPMAASKFDPSMVVIDLLWISRVLLGSTLRTKVAWSVKHTFPVEDECYGDCCEPRHNGEGDVEAYLAG